jgi:hypothetical protein
VDKGSNQRRFESVYSLKMYAGNRRTYFFDVRQTKGNDYYLTLTESTRRFDGNGVERHKIFLYKEDFNRFLDHLEDAIGHIKENLLPDYDYDEFNRRDEDFNGQDGEVDGNRIDSPPPQRRRSDDLDDDMSW